MEPIISAKDLCKEFPVKAGLAKRTVGYVHAVDHMNLDLYEGKTYSLIGESGCGKTTTSRLLLLLYEPTSGDIIFRGKKINKQDKKMIREYRRTVQAVFQDPYSSLEPRMRVRDIIAEPLIECGYDKSRINQRVDEVLEVVRLPGRANNYPHEFSGGERQRIAIARALASRPEVVTLDEPVSALDVSVRAQVMNSLKEAQEKYNLSYLLIAHDLGTVRYMSDYVGVMYLGRLIESGPSEEVFDHPVHPYTQGLFKASLPFDIKTRSRVVPMIGEIPSPLKVPSGCPFHPRCPHVCDRCKEEKPVQRDVGSGHLVACHLL